MDFSSDKVYFLNRITGEKREKLPFGIDSSKVKIVPKIELST